MNDYCTSIDHVMIRVTDLRSSLKFYTQVFNMDVLKINDYYEQKFTIAFVGYLNNRASSIELTYNWANQKYDIGNGFGHIAIKVKNLSCFYNRAKNLGVKIIKDPFRMKGSTAYLAFISDPDGYKIELIELL